MRTSPPQDITDPVEGFIRTYLMDGDKPFNADSRRGAHTPFVVQAGLLSVQASVVEPVDVLGDGGLEVVDVLPGSLVADELGLEQ
nr:hypothetical protein [uncultured Serinicoccus sp.]